MTIHAAIDDAIQALRAALDSGDGERLTLAAELALHALSTASERAERARADAARQRALNVEAVEAAGGLFAPEIGRTVMALLVATGVDALTDDALAQLVDCLPLTPLPAPSLPRAPAALAAVLPPPRALHPVNDR